jgi:hypothetical protein
MVVWFIEPYNQLTISGEAMSDYDAGILLHRKPEEHAMEMPKMVSIAGLKSRGWTPAMVAALLGEPDTLGRNPHYAKAAPMRLYALARIEAAEGSPEFAAAKAKAAGRIAGAQKATATKRTALLRQVRAMQVVIKVLPDNVVLRRAIGAFNAMNEDCVSKDASEEFLQRITVNYIRHRLTTYDQTLEEIAGRVGIDDAVQAIRCRIYEAIAERYPTLARECNRQMMRRGL